MGHSKPCQCLAGTSSHTVVQFDSLTLAQPITTVEGMLSISAKANGDPREIRALKRK